MIPPMTIPRPPTTAAPNVLAPNSSFPAAALLAGAALAPALTTALVAEAATLATELAAAALLAAALLAILVILNEPAAAKETEAAKDDTAEEPDAVSDLSQEASMEVEMVPDATVAVTEPEVTARPWQRACCSAVADCWSAVEQFLGLRSVLLINHKC